MAVKHIQPHSIIVATANLFFFIFSMPSFTLALQITIEILMRPKGQ